MINYANITVSFYDGLVDLPLQGFNSLNNCACIYKTVSVLKSYKWSEAILEPLPNNLT